MSNIRDRVDMALLSEGLISEDENPKRIIHNIILEILKMNPGWLINIALSNKQQLGESQLDGDVVELARSASYRTFAARYPTAEGGTTTYYFIFPAFDAHTGEEYDEKSVEKILKKSLPNLQKAAQSNDERALNDLSDGSSGGKFWDNPDDAIQHMFAKDPPQYEGEISPKDTKLRNAVLNIISIVDPEHVDEYTTAIAALRPGAIAQAVRTHIWTELTKQKFVSIANDWLKNTPMQVKDIDRGQIRKTMAGFALAVIIADYLARTAE